MINRCYGIEYLMRGVLRKCLLWPDEYVERTNLKKSEANRLQYNERYRCQAWGKIPFLPQRKVPWTHVLCFHSPNFGQQAFWTHVFERMHVSSGYCHLTSSLPPPLERDRAHYSSLITSSDLLGSWDGGCPSLFGHVLAVISRVGWFVR